MGCFEIQEYIFQFPMYPNNVTLDWRRLSVISCERHIFKGNPPVGNPPLKINGLPAISRITWQVWHMWRENDCKPLWQNSNPDILHTFFRQSWPWPDQCQLFRTQMNFIQSTIILCYGLVILVYIAMSTFSSWEFDICHAWNRYDRTLN